MLARSVRELALNLLKIHKMDLAAMCVLVALCSTLPIIRELRVLHILPEFVGLGQQACVLSDASIRSRRTFIERYRE